MAEQEIKAMCKLAVEHPNHPLTDLDKELLNKLLTNLKAPKRWLLLSQLY